MLTHIDRHCSDISSERVDIWDWWCDAVVVLPDTSNDNLQAPFLNGNKMCHYQSAPPVLHTQTILLLELECN